MVTMNVYKNIQERKGRGENISDICRAVERSRNTVRKYYRMNPSEYLQYTERASERGKVFEPFRDEIVELYRLNQGDSVVVASVFDVLEERHVELPGTERTLRNYIRMLIDEGVITLDCRFRSYHPIPQLPYGRQLQVDFGVQKIGCGTKVYLFVAILSASRYRYVAHQDRPFTTDDVVQHLLRCFAFIGGRPEELVIDQDRLMVVSENEGDIIFTEAFRQFREEQELRVWVCRAGDPESKGKVENLVKFVKMNFFSARYFTDSEEIAEPLLRWLARRANGKISQATGRKPAHMHEEERKNLRPLRLSIFQKACELEREPRNVDPKGLIMVGGNRYSVPAEYRNSSVKIFATITDLFAFDAKSGAEVAEHRLSPLTGQTIVQKAHLNPSNVSTEHLYRQVLDLSDLDEWKRFVEANTKRFKRYRREQYPALLRFFDEERDGEILTEALKLLLDHGTVSATNLADSYTYFRGVSEEDHPDVLGALTAGMKRIKEAYPKVTVEKRKIGYYASLISLLGAIS